MRNKIPPLGTNNTVIDKMYINLTAVFCESFSNQSYLSGNFLNLKDSNKINLEFVYLTVDQMIKIYDDIFHVTVYIRIGILK